MIISKLCPIIVSLALGVTPDDHTHDHDHAHDHAHDHPESHSHEKGRDANCAVLGVIAALRTQGIDAPLAEVENHFPDPYRDEYAFVPISVIERVLSEYGVPSRAVQFDVKRVAQKHVPSLLLLNQAEDLGKGHYVLMTSVRGNDVEFIDPSNPTRVIKIPRELLGRTWQGYALCLASSANPSLVEMAGPWLLGLVAVAIVYHLAELRGSVRRSQK